MQAVYSQDEGLQQDCTIKCTKQSNILNAHTTICSTEKRESKRKYSSINTISKAVFSHS